MIIDIENRVNEAEKRLDNFVWVYDDLCPDWLLTDAMAELMYWYQMEDLVNNYNPIPDMIKSFENLRESIKNLKPGKEYKLKRRII